MFEVLDEMVCSSSSLRAGEHLRRWGLASVRMWCVARGGALVTSELEQSNCAYTRNLFMVSLEQFVKQTQPRSRGTARDKPGDAKAHPSNNERRDRSRGRRRP